MVLMSFVSCTIDGDILPQESVTTQSKRTTSVQCSGRTLKGLQCKNQTLSSNGRCYLHGGN